MKKSIYGSIVEEGRHRYFKVVFNAIDANNKNMKIFHRDVVVDIPVNEETQHHFNTSNLEYFGNILVKEREIKMETIKSESKEDIICEVVVCKNCGNEIGLNDVVSEENSESVLGILTCLKCHTRGQWKVKNEEVICD